MKFPAILALVLSLPLSIGLAQKGGKGKGQALSIEGEVLPDLVAVSDSGEDVPLRKALKGKHGVIVFGCLT
ncbi:MAG: hypothetical protein AAGC68_04465 [Verrucomicrobiota bacterium]